MAGSIEAVMQIAVSGLETQSSRIRVIAQNIANAESTSLIPGGEPYRRQTISFGEEFDRSLNASLSVVDRIGRDQSDYTIKYEPSHPAANEDGYVLYPNVNRLIETTDMSEATRSYEANLAMVENARDLFTQTLDLISRF